MHINDVYNAMFHRSSVRKYNPDPLPAETLQELQYRLATFPALNGSDVKLQLLSPTQVCKAITAPHYAVVYAGDDKASLLSAGYLLEYLELAMFSQGIGSCYNGMARPHTQYLSHEGLGAKMILAFGTPLADAVRTGPSAFRRKELSDIAAADVPLSISEAVRVAPSAINGQPWYLDGDRDEVEVYYSPRGLRAKMAASTAYIDMGIALAHLNIAAEKQGMGCAFDFRVPAQQATSKKRELICRVKLS